ncbi:MAG: ECF transporter S component [Clostridiaceae bacterium]|nr:ECF transporter S component [Clostridiaceae bacterium]
MRKISTKNLILAGLFIALGLLMPFLTAQIPSIGSKLLPMHIPVLLCGFVLGWPYGLIVGLIVPVFRSLLFTMPPMFPTAIVMSFELAAYGFATGLLHKLFPKKNIFIYFSLIISMIFGRIIWGLASFIILSLSGSAFTIEAFLAGAFINALPGIIIQIVLIPALVMSLKRIKVLEKAY